MEKEIWKTIPNYENYQVSNLGKVRSLDHYCAGRNGSGKQTGRVLKQQLSKKGYLQVCLNKDKKRFHTGVHRLISICFIYNEENKPFVNHINGIKTDNRIENLEWCTPKENTIHAFKNNLVKLNYGEKHHRSKLNNSDVLDCRCLFEKGIKTNVELSIIYGVSPTAMSNILRNKTYINIK